MSQSLVDAVEACLLPARDSAGVVAVSGGPDSIALARALVILQGKGVVGELILAHLNHQLRGPESDADEAFVAEFAAQLMAAGARARVCTRRIDVAGEARARGENLENCARRLRYDWFTEVARADGAAWVATGHTADDQAETVVHRLLRGAGLHGLSGIPARRALAPGVDLLRPLLRLARADVLAFLNELGQPYRQDSSNTNLHFTRNRLRQELLPLLKDYNPAIVPLLCRLAEQAHEAQQIIEKNAQQLLQQVELPRAGELVVLSAEVLATASRHLRAEVFRLVWTREHWPAGEMNFEDWQRLAVLAEAAGGAADFPHGMRARRTGRVVQLGRS